LMTVLILFSGFSSTSELIQVLTLLRTSPPSLAVLSFAQSSCSSPPLTLHFLPRCGLSGASRCSDQASGLIKRVPEGLLFCSCTAFIQDLCLSNLTSSDS
uniref:Uncharacterized protein n=1 Tax=Seriola dumerili TaxID=41447 RepID=A0A3B4U042_SERDU